MELDFQKETEKTAKEFFHKYEVEMRNGKIKGFRAAATAAAQDMVDRLNFPRVAADDHVLLWAAEQYFKCLVLDLFRFEGKFQDHQRCDGKDRSPRNA